MNDFFDSLKSDLLDRRLISGARPAGRRADRRVAYAVLGGGSSATAPNTAVAPVDAGRESARHRRQPSQDCRRQAGAETTSGSPQQTGGASRNPFAPMPGVKQAQAASAAATSSSGASAGQLRSGSSAASSIEPDLDLARRRRRLPRRQKRRNLRRRRSRKTSRRSSTSTSCSERRPRRRRRRRRADAVQRAQAAAAAASSSQPLVVFRGVLAGGKSATFTLVGEAILRGRRYACRAPRSARRSTSSRGRPRNSNTCRRARRRRSTS